MLLDSGGEAIGRPDTPADLRETFKRFEPTGARRRTITVQLAERRRNMRARDPQLPAAATELGAQGQPARRARRLGERELPGARQPGGQHPRSRCGCCRARSTRPTHHAGQGRRLAEELGPGAPAAAPGGARARPVAAADAAVPARDHADDRDAAAAVRPRRARRPCATLRAAAEDLAVVTPRLTRTSRSSTRSSTRWPTTRPARRRATCSGPPGPTTPDAPDLQARRTRTARSAAASC